MQHRRPDAPNNAGELWARALVEDGKDVQGRGDLLVKDVEEVCQLMRRMPHKFPQQEVHESSRHVDCILQFALVVGRVHALRCATQSEGHRAEAEHVMLATFCAERLKEGVSALHGVLL